MPLTLAQIDALLADNASGDISAADMRTITRALHRKNVGPYSLDDPDDVWWEGDLGDFTTVTVSGSQTITELDGILSASFTGQGAGQVNGILKPHTFAIGDAFATSISYVGVGPHTMGNLIFAAGAAAGSASIHAQFFNDPGGKLSVWSGPMNSVGGPSWSYTLTTQPWGGIFVKMTYVAANTFRVEASPDGISWSTLGQADVSYTLTPTHVGVGWSKWGQAGGSAITFGPICKLA